MAFYFFAAPDDMAEIFADIEGEAPVRIVYEHEKTGTEKACYESVSEIPGFSEDGLSARHRPGFLVFPFQAEPVMTEVEVPTRTLMCIYRTDNPDAVSIRQPSLLYVESLTRPELRAGELDFFAVGNMAGEPKPTDQARLLARRMRKAIRRRSVLLHSEGAKRIYVARHALELARNGDVDLYWQHRCWSVAETPADAEILNELRLPVSAARSPLRPIDTSHNIVPIRKFNTRRVEFREPTEPDVLFVAACDDLLPVFDASHCVDDLKYSRLGLPRYRSICAGASDLPGLGASHTKREITSGIIGWRGESGDYHKVCEPFALADYRIGLLPSGYIAPSIAVFPGGVLLRGRSQQPKVLYCGYARAVHSSGEDHFAIFRDAIMARQKTHFASPDLPSDLAILPQAARLIDDGMEPDKSILSLHIMHHRLESRPDNVVSFPFRPDTNVI